MPISTVSFRRNTMLDLILGLSIAGNLAAAVFIVLTIVKKPKEGPSEGLRTSVSVRSLLAKEPRERRKPIVNSDEILWKREIDEKKGG
jgi:hypothetical protein